MTALIATLLQMLLMENIEDVMKNRGHGEVWISEVTFTESDRELSNPYRGFYHLYGFRIRENQVDYKEEIKKRFAGDEELLSLVEINLNDYVDGEIGDLGLQNIETLLSELDRTGKKFIVRFLYDWDGENLKTEPQNVEIITEHMRQLAEIVNHHSSEIFILQGLFIGNYGEMNNSEYTNTEDMKKLAECLDELTDDAIFLAVRTPLQWRKIMEKDAADTVSEENKTLRLGLFNDGMLGSSTDCGTYGSQTKASGGLLAGWTREEELEFQDILCRRVPNGGEVILDNEYNDFENAVRDMRTMHVTYINRDYDQEVFRKWQQSIVRENGCFDGMDGLTYIDRHLGYRILIDYVLADYEFGNDTVSVDISLRNTGFAPIYRAAELSLSVRDESGEEIFCENVADDLRTLSGGDNSNQELICHVEVPLQGIGAGKYQIYFMANDGVSGRELLFANTQDSTEYGYLVAKLELEDAQEYIDRWIKEHDLEQLK